MSDEFIINVSCSADKKALEGLAQAVQIIEQALPPLNLHYEPVGDEKNFGYEPIANLKAWLLAKYVPKTSIGFLFLDPQQKFKISVYIQLKLYELFVASGTPASEIPTIDFTLHIPYQDQFLAKGWLMAKAVGELCSPYHLVAKSFELSKMQSTLTRHPHDTAFEAPYGLPIFPGGIDLPREAFIPYRFTWINYWSEETAAYMDWSDDKASLFYKTERTQNGGLMLQLTEQPTTMERVEHQDALRNAYLAFPKVGGRYWAEKD